MTHISQEIKKEKFKHHEKYKIPVKISVDIT